jgi:hypothetical protein
MRPLTKVQFLPTARVSRGAHSSLTDSVPNLNFRVKKFHFFNIYIGARSRQVNLHLRHLSVEGPGTV